jgi:hypothetical protein
MGARLAVLESPVRRWCEEESARQWGIQGKSTGSHRIYKGKDKMRRRVLERGLLIGLVGLCLAYGTPARATTTQLNTPFTATLIDPCTNELVDVSGVAHLVIDFTISSSGNFIIGTHSNEHDVTGVGETTGTTYTGSGNFESQSFQGTAPATMTEMLDTTLIAKGSAPNFTLHALAHITVDAQGNVTAFVSDFTATCQ